MTVQAVQTWIIYFSKSLDKQRWQNMEEHTCDYSQHCCNFTQRKMDSIFIYHLAPENKGNN